MQNQDILFAFALYADRVCWTFSENVWVFEGSLRPALKKTNRRLLPNRKLSLEQYFYVLKHICFMMNTKLLFWMNHLYEHLKTFFLQCKKRIVRDPVMSFKLLWYPPSSSFYFQCLMFCTFLIFKIIKKIIHHFYKTKK